MLAPLLGWAFREWKVQRAAAERRERVQERADAIWQRGLITNVKDPQLTEDARELQNDIYTQRTDSPAVFRWVYEWARDEDEAAMRHAAQVLVAAYEQAQGDASNSASINRSRRIGEGSALGPRIAAPELSRVETK